MDALITVTAHFSRDGMLYHDDPRHGRDHGYATRLAPGDIVHLPEGDASLAVDIGQAHPSRESIFLTGLTALKRSGPSDGRAWQPYPRDLGRRGISGPLPPGDLGRSAFLSDNEVISAKAINFQQGQDPQPAQFNRAELAGTDNRQYRRDRDDTCRSL